VHTALNAAPWWRWLPQPVNEDWRLLQALGLYRVLLVTLLVSLHEAQLLMSMIGSTLPLLFHWTGRAYAVVALLLMLPALRRQPALHEQVMLGFAFDALALTLIVSSSGGIGSGLAVLLIPATVGVGLLLSARLALLAAATAFLMLFAQETIRLYPAGYAVSEYASLGPLGLMLFVTTIGASAVARRVRMSEARAARVGSEFADLSRLNEIVLDTLRAGVLVVDGDDTIRLMNAAALRLLGERSPRTGQPLAAVLPNLLPPLRRWRNGRPSPETVLRPEPSAGTELLPRFRRLGSTPDSPVLILLEDAAHIREQAQQIKLAALGRLSASIAHEIRNPLAAITHAGQLLAESQHLGAPDRRLLDIVQRHGRRIDTIIKDVMNLSRAAAEPRILPLREWLDSAARLYEEAHPERQAVVRGDTTLAIRFDPGHLHQVVFNLLDNAWLHGGRDGHRPTVTLLAARSDEDGHLDVIDDGPGIAPEMAEQLFEPFQTSTTQGTGLGLYLARELCAYNQARLSHHTGAPGGTTFRITFTPADADRPDR
jgi:two-component system, NtrC family, sensor histidine kinase PilS